MGEGKIENDIQAAIAAGKINGAILCASDAAGRFQYNKAFGERTLLSGEKRAQQLDDVISLASATKLLTTVAALQCVEDGLLSLTGDLSTIAPELAAKQVLTGFSDDGSEPILEPQARPVTLEMLLTHSGGTAYHFINPQIARWREKFGRSGAQDKLDAKDRQRLLVEETFDYPLSSQPGAVWAYGAGLDWAGRIVERVTGKTLGAFMDERIFTPLGVGAGEAQFAPVTDPALRARMVDLSPDDPDGTGRLVVGGGTGDHNRLSKGAFGGQGMFMTAPAYVKVLHSLLANDGKILKPATVDNMFQHHLSPEATAAQKALLDGPMGVFFRIGTATGSKAGYGLGGLLTLEQTEGMFGSHTLTWGGGMTLTWFIDRSNDLCGIAAMQARLPFDGETAEALKQSFRKDIYRIRRDADAAAAKM